MAFRKMETGGLPARQWTLVGDPNVGKSSFAAQMLAPMLVIDADHRFEEVATNVNGNVFELSDNPADNVDAEQISKLIKANMAGSGVKTIIVDSLTSIITPLVVEAIMDNDAGRNKNRVSAFKDKALAMRLLQDSITGTGVDTLWIYHTRSGMDGQAKEKESTSISTVELARLRRSLNMQLRVVVNGEIRGIKVDWARRGRSGMTIWDETGKWIGMPAKIEKAVYGGLSTEDMNKFETAEPTSFASMELAIAWGVEQEAFRDAVHAANSYNKIKAEKKPKTAAEMWAFWIQKVKDHKAEVEEEAARSGEPIFYEEAVQEAA